MICFDPLTVTIQDIDRVLKRGLEEIADAPLHQSSNHWLVPVCYDPALGPDLDDAAHTLGLAVDDLIDVHSSATYRVYMIGFAPVYAYLGGLPPELELPRRQTPRLRVEAGSIAIAGKQACVFSNAAPSGWHILGQTALKSFDPICSPPCLFAAGDRVQFRPVSRTEHDVLAEKSEAGEDLITTCRLAGPSSPPR